MLDTQSPFDKRCDSWTLDTWQSWFAEIYGHRNRVLSPEGAWYRQLEEIGEIVKLARSPQLLKFRDAIPDIPAWLFAFCDVVGISLQEAVWRQFNEGCPWCRAQENCSCIYDYPSKQVKRTRVPGLFAAERDLPLVQWVQLFDKLYGQVYRRHDLPTVVTFLQETAGVVAKCRRTKASNLDLQEAVANFFAWCVGVFLRWKSILMEEISLGQLMIEKYANCPKCHHRPCTCRPLVTSLLIGITPCEGIDTELERRATRLAQEKAVDCTFAHRVGGLGEQMRYALRTDATAVILSRTVSCDSAALYHMARETGKEIVVLACEVEADERLTEFLQEELPTGCVHTFADEDPLDGLGKWLGELPRRDSP